MKAFLIMMSEAFATIILIILLVVIAFALLGCVRWGKEPDVIDKAYGIVKTEPKNR